MQIQLLSPGAGAQSGGTSRRPLPARAGGDARRHHRLLTPLGALGGRGQERCPRTRRARNKVSSGWGSLLSLGPPGCCPSYPRLPALSERCPSGPSSLPPAFLPSCTPSLSPNLKSGYPGQRMAEWTGTQAPSPAPSPLLSSPAPPSSSCRSRPTKHRRRGAPSPPTYRGAQTPRPSRGVSGLGSEWGQAALSQFWGGLRGPGTRAAAAPLWKALWALGMHAECHNGLRSLDSTPYRFDLLPTRRPRGPPWSPSVSCL